MSDIFHVDVYTHTQVGPEIHVGTIFPNINTFLWRNMCKNGKPCIESFSEINPQLSLIKKLNLSAVSSHKLIITFEITKYKV